MNMILVFTGIETGSQRVLNYLKRQACSVEQNYNAVRILRKYGMVVDAGVIIGSPDETREEMMETYKFLRKSKVDVFYPSVLTPFPGTPVWDLAKRRGLVNEQDMDWGALRMEFNEISSRHPILAEKVSKEELLGIYRKFRRLRKRKLFYAGLKNPRITYRSLKNSVKKQLRYLKALFSGYSEAFGQGEGAQR